MLDFLIQLDREVFLFLNNLGSETFDGFWLFITKQFNWIPIFLIILYLVFKHLGWKHALLIIFTIAVLITLTDQTTNLFKFIFKRLRPCSEPVLEGLMREVQSRGSFSFFSGHASNSMAVAFFLFMVLKPYLKYMGFIFIWPFIFAYSRIYLGLHYPSDILCGYLWGILMALIMLKVYALLRDKIFPKQKEYVDNPTHDEPIKN